MTYRSITVSHSEATGFKLNVLERSQFRDFVFDIADKICAFTGHRFETLFTHVAVWADKKIVDLVSIPITRAEADILAIQPDVWDYLDEPDMSEDELHQFMDDMDARIAEYDAKPWYSKFVLWIRGQ